MFKTPHTSEWNNLYFCFKKTLFLLQDKLLCAIPMGNCKSILYFIFTWELWYFAVPLGIPWLTTVTVAYFSTGVKKINKAVMFDETSPLTLQDIQLWKLRWLSKGSLGRWRCSNFPLCSPFWTMVEWVVPRMSLIAEIFVGIEANEKAIVPWLCAALPLIEL